MVIQRLFSIHLIGEQLCERKRALLLGASDPVLLASAWLSEYAMRMSRSTAYAIGAVLQLGNAPPGQPVPCSRLAKTGEMPERFLLQILRTLVNHGLLKSTRGVDGGYSLTRPLTEISLLQIFEATEGPLTPSLPPLDGLPEVSQSKLLTLLEGISAATCRSLAQVKMSDLFSPKTGESPPIIVDQDDRKPKPK